MFECQTDALGIEVKILFASKRLKRKARPVGECPKRETTNEYIRGHIREVALFVKQQNYLFENKQAQKKEIK